MILDRLKKTLPLLIGGTGLGLLLSPLVFKPTIPTVPTPEYRIALKGGMLLIPGTANNEATSIRYNIELDGINKQEVIAPTDTIFLDFEWSEQLQSIEIEYLNEEQDVIGVHNARIGDGLIVDDLIIISKDSIPKTEQ